MKYRWWISIALLLFLAAGTAAAQSLSDIKQGMKDRLPAIADLKSRGIVGENNDGFLEFVGDQKEKTDVIQAENADRAAVYQHIAQQQGASATLVGQRRAVQIRDTAPAGVWLQDDAGKWYQK
jgi:uncharacterized protein YdbL (DUF1318 family)